MTKRLNTTHRKLLDLLRQGPRSGSALAVHTHTPLRATDTALRALRREECVERHGDSIYALTPKGKLLAQALHLKALKKQREGR